MRIGSISSKWNDVTDDGELDGFAHAGHCGRERPAVNDAAMDHRKHTVVDGLSLLR